MSGVCASISGVEAATMTATQMHINPNKSRQKQRQQQHFEDPK